MFAVVLSAFLASMPQGLSGIADKTAGMQRLEGFRRSVLGRVHGQALLGDRLLRSRVPLSGLARLGTREQSGRPRSRSARKHRYLESRQGGSARAAPRAQLSVSRHQRQPRRGESGRRRVRALRSLGVRSDRFDGHGRAGGRDRFLPSGHARGGTRDGAGGAGKLPARPEPERLLHASHEELSEEHRGRGAPHLHEPETR